VIKIIENLGRDVKTKAHAIGNTKTQEHGFLRHYILIDIFLTNYRWFCVIIF